MGQLAPQQRLSALSIVSGHSLVLVFCVDSSSLQITKSNNMNKIFAIAAMSALAGSAFAQLSPLPPSSTTDGVSVKSIGLNAGATHWESASTLGAYRFASDGTLTDPNTQSPDNALGLNWASNVNLSAFTILNTINAQGGTVRAIFTGESAGWLNAFGYTYSGNPQGPDSFTVLKNIQSVPPTANTFFGDYVDINLAPGAASTFDFWLDGVGSNGPDVVASNTEFGGVYTAIRASNSTPYLLSGNVRWAQSPLMVNTWVPALGAYANVGTYLVSVEDWRLDRGTDGDYNDFMFALQFFSKDGTPFTPVPEPSTYGLIGAVALLGLVARRRFVAKK